MAAQRIIPTTQTAGMLYSTARAQDMGHHGEGPSPTRYASAARVRRHFRRLGWRLAQIPPGKTPRYGAIVCGRRAPDLHDQLLVYAGIERRMALSGSNLAAVGDDTFAAGWGWHDLQSSALSEPPLHAHCRDFGQSTC